MRPVAIAVAPVGAVPFPENPLTPRQIALDTIACVRAGASIAHLHVRDETGKLVEDTTVFEKTVEMIKADVDVIIQASTGGMSDLTAAERCTALSVEGVEMASLNMGSSNFGDGVYINSPADIRYWAEEMHRRGIKPELEIFEPGMIEAALKLRNEGLLEDPLVFNFSLGFPGAMAANPKNCLFLSESIPPGAKWSVVHHEMKDFKLLACALSMGAYAVRVGFEDSRYINSGLSAGSNAELVSEIATVIRKLGFRIMDAAETRQVIGI